MLSRIWPLCASWLCGLGFKGLVGFGIGTQGLKGKPAESHLVPWCVLASRLRGLRANPAE